MRDIIEFFNNLLKAESWPARWVCGKWTSFHGWLYIISDVLIWGAYFAIPIIIIVFIQKRKHEVPFLKIFWLFIMFILACGTTHLLDAIMFWYPAYRLNGFLLVSTALISWATVISLIKILPAALSLKSSAQLENIIYERTSQLEESNAHQIKLNRDLDHFIYSASHDLKSPINNIEGLAMLLKTEIQQYNNADSMNLLSKIDDSIYRVKASINSLTDALKVQRNPYEDKELVSFNDIYSEIMLENEELVKTANAVVDHDFQVESITYSRQGLKSIVYNLLTNAVKYRSPRRQAKINVRTFLEQSRVVLTLEDNGLGIDLERHKEKVFTIFKRLHDHVEGSGVGLYIIKHLIEENKGTIDVSSQIDKGTVFKVVF